MTASFTTDRLESMFKKKLLGRLEPGDHRFYVFSIDGKDVARTKISRGASVYGDGLCAQVAKQLHISNTQLTQLVQCTMSCDEWVAHMRAANRV